MMIVAVWGAGVVGFVLGCAWSDRRVGRLEADVRLMQHRLLFWRSLLGPTDAEVVEDLLTRLDRP
jgi:hypothetical protein